MLRKIDLTIIAVLIILSFSFKMVSLSQTNPIYFTEIVLATYYNPNTSGSKEVALPDVFATFAMQGKTAAFDNNQWYPGPGRTYTEKGVTFNWNSSTDFAQYKSNFKNFYLNTNFRVRITYRGVTREVPVREIGPWNWQDNYWSDKAHSDPAQRRRLHTEVNRGYPQSTAAFFSEFGQRRDEAGRIPNGAGIDISAPLAQELGFPGKDWVLVEFLWLPPEYRVGDWVQARTGGDSLYVRSSPGRRDDNKLGKVPDGSVGQIVNGYVVADNYLWWEIDWGNNLRGWSAGRYLEKAVNQPAGVLSVSPTDGLSSSGTQGGPFSPSSKTYTLTNTGGTSINWTATKSQSWITLSSTSGTLSPGSSTTVTVSINSNANSLSAGSYSDNVVFTNTTNGNGNTTRVVTLTVSTPTTVETLYGDLPTRYSLNQNYPNPFNPETSIEFDIPERVNVKLTIYDLFGREIAVLVDEELGAGRYKVRFGSENLSSGIYFYELRAGRFREVKKMVLMK